jgi:hypothetical protein
MLGSGSSTRAICRHLGTVGAGPPHQSGDTLFRSHIGRRIPGSILAGGEQLATATNQRLRNALATRRKNGSHARVAAEFAVGSLETELSAIGTAVPASAWAKVPTDYFANLDQYLHGAPKKK